MKDSLIGCLLGIALGDSIGLPMENISPRRARRLFPPPVRQRFVFGRGMVSDDTEHACLTAQSLITTLGEPDAFVHDLAKRMRRWLLGLPLGTGRATLKATLKLWLGWSPHRSGVWSAGNGPCMRAPILGICFGDDPARLRELVRLSTRITHTDPKAEQGALAVALAAYHASRSAEPTDPHRVIQQLTELLDDVPESFQRMLALAALKAEEGEPTTAFAHSLGLRDGVTGYVYHTVPVALHAAWQHPDDFRTAVEAVIDCGGDTDTLAAIVGGIVGAHVGKAGLPEDWLTQYGDWPRTTRWLERLAERLSDTLEQGQRNSAQWLNPVALFVRNVVFNAMVMLHVLRRLLPPY